MNFNLRHNSPAVFEALKNRRPFTTSGSTMVAVNNPIEDDPMGHLPQEWAERLRQGLIDNQVTYVVYSYDTPIAWVHGREVVIPDVKYSATTTRHQKVVKEHLLADPAASLPQFSVTWDYEDNTFDAHYWAEADRDARIVALVKDGAKNVRIEEV